jgi:DNA repair exonuclease SbcCD ATPase subunit
MVETKGKETEKSMLSERLANLEKLISSFDSIDVEKLNEYRSQMSILESEIASLSKDYLEATTKEQNKQQFKKRIEDNMTTLGDYDVNSLKEENLKEKQTSFFNLQESIKKLESDLIQVRNLQNQIDNCQKNINKLNEALQLNNEKFKSFKCIALEGSGLILNEPSMEILQNTRAYVKLQEVKAREPELLENFGFNSNDNLDKICNELQSFIYEYNRSQTIIKSYNMGDEPISSRATVEGHIASIQKVLDFVDTQKTEIKNNENLKLTNDKIAKTEVELSELNSKKSELITSISHEKVKSESSVTDIISIKTEISMSVGDNLNCPECSSNLEFHSGKLCKITKTRISKEDSLKLISLLDNLSHIIQAISSKESEIVRLKSEKETLPTPRMEYVNAQVYPEDVVTKYAKIVSDLKSISWDNLKTSYEVVKTKEDAERALKAINSLKLRGSWEKEYETANKNFNSGLGTLPETDETYLRNYESELMVLPSYRMEKSNIESQLSTLNSEIFDYNSQIIKYDNVSKLESCIVEYKETLKEKEKELIALRQYAALYNEIQRLKTEESNILILYSSIDIKTNIDLKSNELSSLKETVSAYSSYEHTMNEYDSIKKKIMEINISESSESINTKIESLNTQINTNEVRITEGKTLYLMIKTRSELEETGKRVTEFTNTQSSLNRLRLLVTEVTNSALQSLVDSINAVVNEILADLFDNTITLELKLFKENKANTKVKPQVNFSIFYNGNTYENVNALSGGEKDRVSLALTLALACVNPSPILFLDECMASLNGDLRENCIEAIKKFIISTYKKTVINICHETVEGYYDEVVSV